MKKIEALIRKELFQKVDDGLKKIGVTGLTFQTAEGRGRAKGEEMAGARGSKAYRLEYIDRIKIEVVVKDGDSGKVVSEISKVAKTGQPGDGKIFVSTVENVIDISSGASGDAAL